MSHAVADPRTDRRRLAFLGACSGHLIEWYDYGVYGFLAVYIGTAFFSTGDTATALLSSYAAFALSFFMRPLGGILFGPIADRLGRRGTMVVVMVLMAGSTFCIGVLPDSDSIGLAAPFLLVFIRCLQGFSAGGEIGTITSFIAEHASPGRRGFSTSWLMVTAVVGLTLGGVVANGMVFLLGAEAMGAGGWRLPFLLAGPLGLIALFIRLRLDDSPVFVELKKAGGLSKAPLREVFSHKRAMGFVFFIIALHASAFYFVLTFSTTFIAEFLKFDSGTTLLYVFLASACATVVIPFGGLLTDRFGRRNLMIVVAILSTISSYWLFQSASSGTPETFLVPLLAVAILFGLYVSSTYAVMTELLPARIRSTGIALSYNLSIAIFGGSAPLISTWLIEQTDDVSSPWYFYVGTGVVSAIALMLLRPRDFVSTGGAQETTAAARALANLSPLPRPREVAAAGPTPPTATGAIIAPVA